jgi:hypothetical protein
VEAGPIGGNTTRETLQQSTTTKSEDRAKQEELTIILFQLFRTNNERPIVPSFLVKQVSPG